jgi:hypothetical protein
MKHARNWSVGLGLALALFAAVVSQKVLFADGIHFFIRGLVDPLQFHPLGPRVLAISFRNVLSMIYTWAGGKDLAVALACFSVGAFAPAIGVIFLLRQRALKGEAGAVPVLLMTLLGVFLLINFPASELITCIWVNALLVHGYMTGRARQWPILTTLGILLASLSYEVSLLTNAMFLAYVLADAGRRKQHRWHALMHLLGMLLVVALIWHDGVNGNSHGMFSLMTVVSALILVAVATLAFTLGRHWWALMAVLVLGLTLVVAHALPHFVFALLGRVFTNFSYESRGVSALIAILMPLLLFSPKLLGRQWSEQQRQRVDALIVIWAAFQMVSAMAWHMFWSDYKVAVLQQPAVLAYEQCAACRNNPQVYRQGVFTGWAWTWPHLSTIASLQLGLATRQVVVQKENAQSVSPAEFEQVWQRFAVQNTPP